uniref:cytochrome C oxidase subunit IV family protein n=1 Tax=Mariniflexile sp. TaxID=1979402 RepID=UPI004047D4CE
MHKTTTITYIILISLTITSAILSKLNIPYVVIIILLLAVLKFIGISFQFMELKKANPFWKGMVLGFLLLFTAIVLAVK